MKWEFSLEMRPFTSPRLNRYSFHKKSPAKKRRDAYVKHRADFAFLIKSQGYRAEAFNDLAKAGTAFRFTARYVYATKDKKLWGAEKTTKPDLDNLIKATKDALWDRDQCVTRYGPDEPCKLWGERDGIHIKVETID